MSYRLSPALTLALLLPLSGTSARAAEPPAPASSGSPAVQLSDVELGARLERYLAAAATEGFTGNVLVARRGTVLFEKGYGSRVPGRPNRVAADTVYTTGSITKQFTAAAILKLEEAGKLRVTDPMASFLDGVPDDKRAITIHHLLTHQAGFPGAIGDDLERIGRDEFVRQALATPLQFAAGTKYDYSNVGYSLAAAIVEKVSGQGYEAFLHERLFAPAGMQETGYHLPRWSVERLAHGVRDDGGDWGTMVANEFSNGGPGWHLLGNGGILSTPRDMYLWHRALAGETILSKASKAKLYGKHADEGGGSWYGYGWSIEPTPWGEMVAHDGGNPFFFADYLRFPDSDVVVYFATSSRERRFRRLARPLARLVFTGEAPPLPPQQQALTKPGSEPAPSGSAAARWGLPGTPAGERAATLLDALSASDGAARTRFAADGFGPKALAGRGADGAVKLLERMRGDLKAFALKGYRPSEAGGLVVVLAPEEIPAPMTITLEVEPEAPHRIAGIGVMLGD